MLADEEMNPEDLAWSDAGLEQIATRLAEIESDVPPDELRAWHAAFEAKARPCVYVPGEGFVVKG